MAIADTDRKGFFMAASSFEDELIEQKFVEELHLYCSPQELESLTKRFQSSFDKEFHEIVNLSPTSTEIEEDSYDLSSELAGKRDLKNLRPYLLKQEFSCLVRQQDGEPVEQELDQISDRVFQVVKESVEEIPYFSVLDLGE